MLYVGRTIVGEGTAMDECDVLRHCHGHEL